MPEFDIRTLFEDVIQKPFVIGHGFSSASEALTQLRKGQVEDIIGPSRPLYEIVEFIGGEVILKYRESGERIVDSSLSYSIPRGKTDSFLGFIGNDNLPEIGKCLVIADFGENLDISIYEKNEEDGKKLVNSEGEKENIFFVSKNYPNGYKIGNS